MSILTLSGAIVSSRSISPKTRRDLLKRVRGSDCSAADATMGHVVVGADEDPSAAHVSLSFAPAASYPMELISHAPRAPRFRTTPAPSMNSNAGLPSDNMQQTLLKDPRVGIDFILAYVPSCLPKDQIHNDI